MNARSISPSHQAYKQIDTRFDADCGALWCYMDPKPRACFNAELLEDLKKFVQAIPLIGKGDSGWGSETPIRHTVLASRTPGVFSFGGDLELFIRFVREKNREGLLHYARTCVDIVYSGVIGYNLPVTTISLVQGDALGGGFEAALCNHVVVAERSAQFGLPEVLFNLFPGMGAYSLLAQRMDPARAERMILSGRVYTADELHEMGVVDVLAENGEGEKAVYDYIARHSRRRNAHQALLRVRRRVRPVSHEELLDIADIWVDSAMNLGPKDLRMMERLAKAQERLPAGSAVPEGVGEGYA